MEQRPSSTLGVIILAAGMGTRMKSALAKVLHPLVDTPMISFPVRAALDAGACQVVVVVGHQREAVEAVLRDRFVGTDLRFAHQLKQLGTGHAVQCGLAQVSDTITDVLVLTGDAPNVSSETLTDLLTATDEVGAVMGFITCRLFDPTGYGRVVRDDANEAIGIVEHKDATKTERALDEVNAGLYLFKTDFLKTQIHQLDSNNAQNEFYVTDLVKMASAEGGRAYAHCVSDPDEVRGINSKAELADAIAYARRRRNRALMTHGVTMFDPASTWVGANVSIGRDVVLWPQVTVVGASQLADGVEVQQGCVVIDSQIGPNSRLKAYSHLESAIVHADVEVGPFGRLRPGSVLHDRSKVGNFVEIKTTELGRGSKASHLSYLGDATIGAGVNIGAGTITCNYDGVSKHRTVLEDEVFVGSDTQLVAPVTVGRGAYVGAGTTITEDVPPGSLAISRVRQRTIEGWVDRKKGN